LRADLLTEPAMDALIDAGMFWCCFALETASPRLQKYTCKVMNIPRLLAAGEHVTRRGVFCNLYCMLGFPTETEEEIRQTIDTACASSFHTASFYTVTPFPGTTLYDQVKAQHPDKVKDLRYDDMDLSSMRVNLTDLTDERLFYYQRAALRRFYGNPRRLMRMVRNHPQSWMLPAYIPIFLYRATKGLLPSMRLSLGGRKV
jgi:anaerobic magnesium-protoporphyrin IX monomethyl ester cyclase